MMSTLLLTLLVPAMASMFEAHSVAVSSQGATAFPVEIERGHTAYCCVQEGRSLRMLDPRTGTVAAVILPENTRAFDVADLDGDGRSEVVLVAAGQIMQIALPPGEEAGGATPLFEVSHSLSHSGPPVRRPLVTQYQGAPALLVPRSGAVELFRPNGESLQRFELTRVPEEDMLYGPSFSAWSINPPQAALPGGLELQASKVHEFDVSGLPIAVAPSTSARAPYRRISPSQLLDAIEQGRGDWPWFPLRTDSAETQRAATDVVPPERVRYAPAPPDFRNTMIRVERTENGAAPWAEEARNGPPSHQYPGLLIPLYDGLPDFNGDGFVDILLWSAPEPGTSVDALARAVVGRVWPVRLAVHLYVPEKYRYAPRANSTIDTELPLSWPILLHDASPLRNAVFVDMDGDGKTDGGWAISNTRFEARRYGSNGFPDVPDFAYEFPEEDVSLVSVLDLDQQSRHSLLFKGDRAFYLFYAGRSD